MPANIDSLIYVNETPWQSLGKDMTSNPPETSAEIISSAELGWTVNALTMSTEKHAIVPDYFTLYREDNDNILGVVKTKQPKIIQNTQTFESVENLLKSDMSVECVASLGRGETVFGCFKISDRYKLLDDDVDHYLVIMNEHLKPDGKVTIMNTPIRVVCQNTLNAALNSSLVKFRIPVSDDGGINEQVAAKVLGNVGDCIIDLNKKSESLVKEKTSETFVVNLLDFIFPFEVVDGHILPTKANDKVAIVRDTFVNQCMEADNLQNYKNTKWQVFNALADFDSHYFSNLTAAYDLNRRMRTIPGFAGDGSSSKALQFLKVADKF